MSLNWLWKDKCGEIVFEQTRGTGENEKTFEYTLSLYEGNAFLIMIHEYKDDNGNDIYNMYSFFVDKTHAKKCLGLQKNSDGKLNNIFEGGFDTFKVLRINKAKSRNYKDIISMFAQAFEKITIEVYTDMADAA